MRGAALKYSWLTYRRESLWFPAALLAVFVLITWRMRLPDIRFAIARAYLGFLVPLLGGVLGAYALLDDPALELRFSTPAGAAQTLGARLSLILAVETACALVFQLFAAAMGVDFSPLGGALGVQLAWLVPTLALVALGTSGALATATCSTGAFLAAAVWLGQLLLKQWMLANGRYVYLFLGVLEPRHPDLLPSRISLLSISLALLAGSCLLLRRQERYLGRGSA